jgi:hypothetical protein
MKIVRIIVAVLLTVLLLIIARRASRGHPEEVNISDNGVTLSMTTVPKGPELGRARIDVVLTGMQSDASAVLRMVRTEKGESADDLSRFGVTPLILADSTKGTYFADLSCGPRGKELDYYIEVRDKDDHVTSEFRQIDGKPWRLRYIGEVPKPVLIGHIAFIFGSLFFISLAALQGLRLIGGATEVRPMALLLALATACAVLGGLPYGFAMNWYAFGGIWEGVPFGTDATDNKTQLLIVYLLFATLVSLGSLTRGKSGRDLFAPRTLGWIGAGSFIVALGIYLIPHSIQFSPAVTYGVCYSFIGLFALIYLIRLLTGRPAQKRM